MAKVQYKCGIQSMKAEGSEEFVQKQVEAFMSLQNPPDIWRSQCRQGFHSPAAQCKLWDTPPFPKIHRAKKGKTMVTKITAVVSDGDAKIEMEGNKVDVINLAIQIAGSTIASLPKSIQPRVIKQVQDSIPRAVQEDAKAIHIKPESEEPQMPEFERKHDCGRTRVFDALTELEKTNPSLANFLREVLEAIDEE